MENAYPFTTKFCAQYLAKDQAAPVDIVARVTEEEFDTEKAASPNFSDGYIENICLYRSVCLQLPQRSRMLLHCSVVDFAGSGYAFLGRSGTGKSTHTRLWLRYLQNCKVVNGDKPILERRGESFIAYGTPWLGKEGWGERSSVALKGLCVLEQAKENSLRRLTPAEASTRLFSQILLPTDEKNASATLELLDMLITNVPAYLLRCDISEEAVQTSFEGMTGLSFAENKRKGEENEN